MVQSQPQQVVTDLHALLDTLPIDAHGDLTGEQAATVAEGFARLAARARAHELAATATVASTSEARRQGATSTGSLLAGQFGGDRRRSDRSVKKATKIAQASETQKAFAAGRITEAQADLITRTLDNLPDTVTVDQRAACETQLLCDAPTMDLKSLSRRADRISEVFAPDEVDQIENDIIESREKQAWKKTTFWMIDTKDGMAKGGFVIPEAQADMLRTALEAICAPQVTKDQTVDDAVHDAPPSYGQRMGWAFCALIEAIPADKLPDTAGVGGILTVNLDYDALLDRVKAATLSTGTKVSAGQARRMACELRILPAVFGGESLPLDHGRAKRLFTGHQRRAQAHRDRGCVFPGCDRPPQWCIAHHAKRRWADGGTTDLDDGVLMCPFHHRVLHDDGWDVVFAEDGIPELIPPASIDARRQPRRHAKFKLAA